MVAVRTVKYSKGPLFGPFWVIFGKGSVSWWTPRGPAQDVRSNLDKAFETEPRSVRFEAKKAQLPTYENIRIFRVVRPTERAH